MMTIDQVSRILILINAANEMSLPESRADSTALKSKAIHSRHGLYWFGMV